MAISKDTLIKKLKWVLNGPLFLHLCTNVPDPLDCKTPIADFIEVVDPSYFPWQLEDPDIEIVDCVGIATFPTVVFGFTNGHTITSYYVAGLPGGYEYDQIGPFHVGPNQALPFTYVFLESYQ